MLGWNFIWGYIYIFFHIMEVEIDINIFFWEDLPFFFRCLFFVDYQFFKKYILLFFCHKSPVPSATWSAKSPSPTQPREGSVASEVLIYLVDCASSPDPYVDFLILQREVQAYFVPFWILKGKVDGWLLTRKPLVKFVENNPRNMVIEIQI